MESIPDKGDIAIVLAAGSGRKFWPYNAVRNKCAFSIVNVPVVNRIVRQLREMQFARIVVVVGQDVSSVRSALRPLMDETLHVVNQSPDLPPGTASAVTGVLKSFALTTEGKIFVVYGDTVVSLVDLVSVWEKGREEGVTASLLCIPLKGERPQDWTTSTLEEPIASGGFALRGVEGHGRDGTHRIGGVFCFDVSILPYLQSQPDYMVHVPVGGMPHREADLVDALATMADDGRTVVALEAQYPCVDMDKPWHIFDATRAVLREMTAELTESRIDASAQIADGAEITGPIVVEAGARIGKRVVIEGPCWIGANANVTNGAIVGRGVVIGAGSRVSDYCLVSAGSVIGRECVVGHGGEFDGVMLDRSYIYHYSEIYGVLGTAVDIGAATVCGTLRFDDADTIHSIGGRREFPRNGANATYFGDYCRTGVNVITQPGVKIGAYSCVGPGIVLYKDVPERKLMLLKQEVIERDWGPERYGW